MPSNYVNYMPVLLLIHNLSIKMLGMMLILKNILASLSVGVFEQFRYSVFLLHNGRDK